MDEMIAELRGLLERATPGPWCRGIGNEGGNIQGANGPVAETRWFGNTHKEVMRDHGNAALIVAMHNALPALLDALTTSRDRERELEADLGDLVDWLHSNQRTIEGEFSMDELLQDARNLLSNKEHRNG